MSKEKPFSNPPLVGVVFCGNAIDALIMQCKWVQDLGKGDIRYNKLKANIEPTFGVEHVRVPQELYEYNHCYYYSCTR